MIIKLIILYIYYEILLCNIMITQDNIFHEYHSPHNIHIYFMCWYAISYRCSNCNCVLATITILCLVNWHGYILKGSGVAISKKEFQKKDIIFFLFFWSSGQSNFPSGSRRRVFNQTHFYNNMICCKILTEDFVWNHFLASSIS